MSWKKWVVWLFLFALFGFLLYPRVVKTSDSEGWKRSANSVKNIVIALHDYHATYERFPPAVVRDKNGQPLYSWRVPLLLFLEQESIYRRFKLDEPWDSPHNKKLLENTPKCYVPRRSGPNPLPTVRRTWHGFRA